MIRKSERHLRYYITHVCITPDKMKIRYKESENGHSCFRILNENRICPQRTHFSSFFFCMNILWSVILLQVLWWQYYCVDYDVRRQSPNINDMSAPRNYCQLPFEPIYCTIYIEVWILLPLNFIFTISLDSLFGSFFRFLFLWLLYALSITLYIVIWH